MSVKRYLLTIGVATTVFVCVVMFVFVPDWKPASLFLGPLIGVIVAFRMGPHAEEVPPGYRRSLLDYSKPNLITAGIWVVFFMAVFIRRLQT